MALLSIETLLEEITESQTKTSLYELAEALGLRPTAWVSGAPTRVLIAIVSKLFPGWDRFRIDVAKSGFLDDASDPWVNLVGELLYGVPRIKATFGTTDVIVDNAGGGLYDFDPGAVVFKNSTTEKTYVNSAAFTVNPGETGVVVGVVAQEAGTESNAGPGEIDDFVTTFQGLTVTNPDELVATDLETKADYIERCKDSLGALSPNGPKTAYEYVATTPELNGGIAVTRVKVPTPAGDGDLDVLLAGPEGPLTSGEIDTIQAALDLWAEPLGIVATAKNATEVALTLTVDVFVDVAQGKSDGDWQAESMDAVRAYVNALPIGGIDLGAGGQVLWRPIVGTVEELEGVLEARLNPEANVALDPDEVATLAENDVTVNVTQVSV